MARIAPSGHRVFPDDTFLRQHAVMHAIATSQLAGARPTENEPSPAPG